MIDSASESLLTLAQAAEQLPRRRRGRKTHVSTLYRWTTAGCRGVRLDTIQVGATRCTSREALQRFFEQLSQGSRGDAVPACGVGSVASRTRKNLEAGRKLEQLGA